MRAPQPEPPIPGSFATPSLLAWIVNGKYVMSLPLYRIETDLKACGATISRQDMANWMMNVHARWLAKVHERMKVELLSHVRIHADETTVQVLKEPNREAKKKSRMWLFCSARCNVPVYVCLCSISCCGFSHDDFSGLGRACRPR
ncbi:IS66 family transposase, partial [Bifidobacterium longum]|uniref:IS66 family transposase n=1 Tax=Bifidobacterium longum TaxID=216816 RepID=UPI002017A707